MPTPCPALRNETKTPTLALAPHVPSSKGPGKGAFHGVLLFLCAATVAMAQAKGPTIIDKPMDGTASKARPAGVTVDTIVLHYSSDVVAHPQTPYAVDAVVAIYTASNSSAHYLIDREGKIYRLVAEDRQAFHAGKGELPWEPKRKDVLNQSSIGIEMLAIGTKDEMHDFMTAAQYDQLKKAHPEYIGYTQAQYKSLNALLDDIVSRIPAIKRDRRHIIGHSDYAPERKHDPGALFDWSKINLDAKP